MRRQGFPIGLFAAVLAVLLQLGLPVAALSAMPLGAADASLASAHICGQTPASGRPVGDHAPACPACPLCLAASLPAALPPAPHAGAPALLPVRIVIRPPASMAAAPAAPRRARFPRGPPIPA